MQNFILIGMPGCGKSTLGKMLAEAIGFDFLDTDDCIIEQYGCSLMELISKMGTEGFIAAEGKVLEHLQTDHTIIATGGSAVYSDAGIQHLKQCGKIVYLQHSLENIEKRVGNLTTRGVACRHAENLADLYAERCPLYEADADIIVPLDDCISVPEGAEKLKQAVLPFLETETIK